MSDSKSSICRECGESFDGGNRTLYCKACLKSHELAQRKAWREANKDKCAESIKKWRDKNQDHVKSYANAYRDGNEGNYIVD